MKSTITLTSKGQFTMPVAIRRALGLNQAGDVLQISFDPSRQTIELTKPASFKDLQKFVQSQAKSRQPIPDNIHDWYENERAKDLKDKGLV